MLSDKQIQQIISENEFLQIQLADANDMLHQREKELTMLRETARQATALKSTIENQLEELSYMQHLLGKKQQKLEGAGQREAAMEDELLQGIRMEKEYYTLKEKLDSSIAQIDDITQQLDETANTFKELRDAKKKITELQSQLDIAQEEKELLQYELDKIKKQQDQQSV
jgi:chromosome segregation ATPase